MERLEVNSMANHEKTLFFGSSGVIGQFHRALTSGPILIIGRKGNVGSLFYSEQPCWPIDTVYFSEATSDINLPFFKYLLEPLDLKGLDRSTAVPGLSRNDYNRIKVDLPPLREQERIVPSHWAFVHFVFFVVKFSSTYLNLIQVPPEGGGKAAKST
jgi:hypothetical protein